MQKIDVSDTSTHVTFKMPKRQALLLTKWAKQQGVPRSEVVRAGLCALVLLQREKP